MPRPAKSLARHRFSRRLHGCLLALCAATISPSISAELDEPFARHADPHTLAVPSQSILDINEPMYFIVGENEGDTTARFQFSFMYRIFDAKGPAVAAVPLLRNLRFAYTQTSLWNLTEESAPFEDTSYRPSLFWQLERLPEGPWPSAIRFGYEHESNGRAGLASRNIDTLFVHPVWHRQLGSRDLLVIPRLLYYLDKEQNPRIRDYRGYGDLIVRLGRDDSWLATTTTRVGTSGRTSIQLDLSHPLRAPRVGRTGGFFYLQAFHGYGETLLDYDRRVDLTVRVGLAIVR